VIDAVPLQARPVERASSRDRRPPSGAASIVDHGLAPYRRRPGDGPLAEHDGKPFFDELVTFITRGPIVAIRRRWAGHVEGRTNCDGRDEPARGRARNDRATWHSRTAENLVHGSDGPESAEREIALFFPISFDAARRTPPILGDASSPPTRPPSAGRRSRRGIRGALLRNIRAGPLRRRVRAGYCVSQEHTQREPAVAVLRGRDDWRSTSAPQHRGLRAGARASSSKSRPCRGQHEGQPAPGGRTGRSGWSAHTRPHRGHPALQGRCDRDFDICEKMLRYFIERVHHRR